MSKYFVITSDEDGGHVDCLDKATLLERLDDDYYGSEVKFLSTMPKKDELNYWGYDAIIICGDIVSPKAVEVVKKYEI